MIDISRLSINRKIAENIPLEEFFSLVNACGISKVELRNDINQVDLCHNSDPKHIIDLCKEYGVEIININALYPFNSNMRDVFKRAEEILYLASRFNIKYVVMCPYKDDKQTSVSYFETERSLFDLAPLFKDFGVKGLVEPLGDINSSLRSFYNAQCMISNFQDVFSILIDSFHLYKSDESLDFISKNINIDNIGLVHLSDVKKSYDNEIFSDKDRVMLERNDAIGNLNLIRTLELKGYKGLYSFEPFSDELPMWDVDKIKKEILKSIDIIRAGNL